MENDFSISDREFEVIQALNRTATQYLVVGGYAVLYYGHPNRLVDDLDIWVNNSKENTEKLIAALQNLQANCEGFSIERFTKPKLIKIDLRASRYEVELFNMVKTAKGISFDEAYSRRNVASQNGEEVGIVSIEHLLEIKRTAAKESGDRLHKELKDIGFLESKSDA